MYIYVYLYSMPPTPNPSTKKPAYLQIYSINGHPKPIRTLTLQIPLLQAPQQHSIHTYK